MNGWMNEWRIIHGQNNPMNELGMYDWKSEWMNEWMNERAQKKINRWEINKLEIYNYNDIYDI